VTRKDYAVFARMFATLRPTDENVIAKAEWRLYVFKVSKIFEKDNPRFDRVKFNLACKEVF
jgi:hypothetical protein